MNKQARREQIIRGIKEGIALKFKPNEQEVIRKALDLFWHAYNLRNHPPLLKDILSPRELSSIKKKLKKEAYQKPQGYMGYLRLNQLQNHYEQFIHLDILSCSYPLYNFCTLTISKKIEKVEKKWRKECKKLSE